MSKKSDLGSVTIFGLLIAGIYFVVKWVLKSADTKDTEKRQLVLAENKLVKWLSFSLAGIGILIQAGSFFIDKSEASPRTLAFFAPKAVNASKGLDILAEKGYLASDNTGFYELGEIAEKAFIERELPKIGINRENIAYENKFSSITMEKQTVRSPDTKIGVDKLVKFYKPGSMGKQSVEYSLFLMRLESFIEKQKKNHYGTGVSAYFFSARLRKLSRCL